MANSSLQVRLDLSAIQSGVACFGTGDQAQYCAVVEITGSQESLARVDDAKQEELLAAYAQFLNSLAFPFQLLVQVHPVDLSWYVTRVEEHARALTPALVAIARDHAAFVQGLTRQGTLLERRIYVVVPWASPADSWNSDNIIPFIRPLRGRRRDRGTADEPVRTETVHRQLTDRCDAVARQLQPRGPARRATG